MGRDDVFYKWGAGVGADLPRVVDAHDEYLVTEDGEEIIDAAAGAAVVNLGHSVSGIGAVAAEQMESVGYLSLSKFTHAAPERLAGRLREMSPGRLDTAFFVGSGSEANELAIKLAHAYHRARGTPEKRVVVGRWQSYHGATLGALSATGNTGRREGFRPLLHDWPHVGPADPYRWPYTGSPAEQARAAARELETVVRQEGADGVAAFVAEPVGGASLPAARPHPAYYEEVRAICDEYDLLFVADEVMTGFGRTGEAFGVDHFDVVPDLLCVGKGLSAGYAPISAVLVTDRVAATFDGEGAETFDHGHTYSGNPVAAAVADEIVDRYTDDLFAAVREKGRTLREHLAPLDDHPMVGDVRQVGLMVGVEFVADRESKEPFDPELAVHDRIYHEALDRGVYVYPGSGSVDGVAGDHVMLTPPLTTPAGVLEAVAETVVGSVDAVHDRVRGEGIGT